MTPYSIQPAVKLWSRPLSNQSGFTIVELMVASVISLILLAGVIQIFVSSKVTYGMMEGQSIILDNGRFATHILTHYIRMAGLQSRNPTRQTQPNGAALAVAIDAPTSSEGGSNPDRIGINFQNPDGTDCIGQAAAGVSNNAFSIAADSNNRLGLFCNGQLLVEGVRNMQVVYGEDNTGDGTADYYVPFNQIINLNNVESVRIALTLFDVRDDAKKAADRVFSTTIGLRNQ